MAALLGLVSPLGISPASAEPEEEIPTAEEIPKKFVVQDAVVYEGHTAEIDVFLSQPAPTGGVTFSVSYNFGSGATATKADFDGGNSLFVTSLTIHPKPERPTCGGVGEDGFPANTPPCGPYTNYGTRGTLRFPVKYDNDDSALSDEPEERVTLTFSATTTGWSALRTGSDSGDIVILKNYEAPTQGAGGQGAGQGSGDQGDQAPGQGGVLGGSGGDSSLPDQGQQQQEQQQQQAPAAEPLAKPGAVQDVQAAIAGKRVTVTWSAPQQGGEPDLYVVRLKTNNKGNAKIKRVDADNTSVTFGKVKAGTHTIYVRAKNEAGGGKWTKTVITIAP